MHHSDAGSQYTALRYTARLADIGAVASIGTVGDSYDNALAESTIRLYKTECVKIDGPFRTVDELELGTLSRVHWFNENRLHSAIGYLTPLEKNSSTTTVRTTPSSTRCRGNSPSTKPGAIHDCFPHLDTELFGIDDDERFVLDPPCGRSISR